MLRALDINIYRLIYIPLLALRGLQVSLPDFLSVSLQVRNDETTPHSQFSLEFQPNLSTGTDEGQYFLGCLIEHHLHILVIAVFDSAIVADTPLTDLAMTLPESGPNICS